MHASYEHKQTYILLAVLSLLPRVCASMDSGLTSRILCGCTVPELHFLGRLDLRYTFPRTELQLVLISGLRSGSSMSIWHMVQDHFEYSRKRHSAVTVYVLLQCSGVTDCETRIWDTPSLAASVFNGATCLLYQSKLLVHNLLHRFCGSKSKMLKVVFPLQLSSKINCECLAETQG